MADSNSEKRKAALAALEKRKVEGFAQRREFVRWRREQEAAGRQVIVPHFCRLCKKIVTTNPHAGLFAIYCTACSVFLSDPGLSLPESE